MTGAHADRPRFRGDLAVEVIDGESVVYDERTADLHHLNATATAIAAACDGRSTAAQITAEVAEAFGVPVAEAEAHVVALLLDLRRAGLLEEGRA